jgi:hypothetical protein
MLIPALSVALAAPADLPSSGTGLEWMTVASVVVPAVLIVVLVWLGTRKTV